MSLEDNKAVIRRFNDEAWNRGNLDIVDELVAPNFTTHFGIASGQHGMQGSSVDTLKRNISKLRNSFPDIHVTIDDVIAEGDKVVVHRTTRGTHKGEYLGINGTDKQVAWVSIGIYRIVDGKLQELWQASDQLGALQQMGAVSL